MRPESLMALVVKLCEV